MFKPSFSIEEASRSIVEASTYVETFVNTKKHIFPFIEEKSFSIVWHYRKTESGLGELRANEIINNMRVLAADKGLQIMPGNKVIEFRNMEVNKGKAAMNWMHETAYDFILAMGDDHTDEDLFKAMPNNGITIKVGSEVSEAKFYLNDHLEIRELLRSILEESKVRSEV